MMPQGFCRRILIEPSSGHVTAELEDDWHRMVVTLQHKDGILTAIDSEMKRWPWTTCRGAIQQVADTFVGTALSDFAKRGERQQNCAHLHDLALFAAAHANDEGVIAYDIHVTDAVDGMRHATLTRNGKGTLDWALAGDRLVAPDELSELSLSSLGGWIATLEKDGQESARILRWAAILAHGRSIEIPDGLSGEAFPAGSCYTFQPDIAKQARRNPDAHTDFSKTSEGPMVDRVSLFN
jgi:hypothetical protein